MVGQEKKVAPYHGSGFYPDSDFSESVLDALIARQRAQANTKRKQKTYRQMTIKEYMSSIYAYCD